MNKSDSNLITKLLFEFAVTKDEDKITSAMDYMSIKLSSVIFPLNNTTAPFMAVLLGEYKNEIEKRLDANGKELVEFIKKTRPKTVVISNKPPIETEDAQ